MPSDYYVSLSVEKGSVHVWSMDQYFSLSLSKGNPNVKHAQAKSDLQGAILWSIVKARTALGQHVQRKRNHVHLLAFDQRMRINFLGPLRREVCDGRYFLRCNIGRRF